MSEHQSRTRDDYLRAADRAFSNVAACRRTRADGSVHYDYREHVALDIEFAKALVAMAQTVDK